MLRLFGMMGIASALVLCKGVVAAEDDPKRKAGEEKRIVGVYTDSFPYRVENVTGTTTFYDYVLFDSTEPNSLGVEVAPVDKALGEQLGLAEGGLVVTTAPTEAAGVKAGLKLHDVLVKSDGQVVKDVKSLQTRIASSNGGTVVFDVVRRGAPTKVRFTTTSRVGGRFKFNMAAPDEYRIGVTLAPVDDTLRSQLSLPEKVGLVVTQVLPDGPSAKAGVRMHDILAAYNKSDVTAVEQFNAALQNDKGAGADLKLIRSGRTILLHVVPEKPAVRNFVFASETTFRPQKVFNPYRSVVLFDATNAASTPKKDSPLGQIAAMRQQIAEMNKSLSALEASLKPAPAGK